MNSNGRYDYSRNYDWAEKYEDIKRRDRERRKKRTRRLLSAVIITALLGTAGTGVEVARRKGLLSDLGAKITTLFLGNEESAQTPTTDLSIPKTENNPEPTPTPTPEPILVPSQELETIYTDGAVLRVTPDQIPVTLTLDSGEVITFDPQQMDELRKRAIASQEPVMVAYYRVQSTDVETELQQNQSSTEHPIYDQLPADFITSEAELASHNVEIMQGKTVKLYIRQSAFTEGGLLHHLEGAERNLRIVVVEGQFVSKEFLSPEQLEAVGDLLPPEPPSITDAVKEYRQAIIDGYQTLLVDLRKDLAKLRAQNDSLLEEEIQSIVRDIEDSQIKFFLFKSGLVSDERLFKYMGGIDPEKYPRGCYVASWISGISTAFVAVGESNPKSVTSKYLYLSFGASGELVIGEHDDIDSSDAIWSIINDKSQPNPLDFKRRDITAPHSDKYPWGAQAINQTWIHEAMHDFLIHEGWWPIYDQDGKTIVDWEKKIIGGEKVNFPNYFEYDTDTVAMEKLLKAWQKWQESGFTDNSGYEFAFLLPGGGYLLTMDGSKPSTQPDKLVNYKPQVDVHSRSMREQTNRRINQALVSARMTARS